MKNDCLIIEVSKVTCFWYTLATLLMFSGASAVFSVSTVVTGRLTFRTSEEIQTKEKVTILQQNSRGLVRLKLFCSLNCELIFGWPTLWSDFDHFMTNSRLLRQVCKSFLKERFGKSYSKTKIRFSPKGSTVVCFPLATWFVLDEAISSRFLVHPNANSLVFWFQDLVASIQLPSNTWTFRDVDLVKILIPARLVPLVTLIYLSWQGKTTQDL